MNIAIIGSGIAGNVAAYYLHRQHDITVFEAGGHIGGHSHTHDIQKDGKNYAVDTGFIVFNDWTYPHFIRLLDELGVPSQPSNMSFSVRCDKSWLEYNGASLNAMFAQRWNLLRPSFYRMIHDIFRFNREAPALLDDEHNDPSLEEYLRSYSREFVDHYIIPMGAAIWSADPQRMRTFPARFFVRFFDNHGLLSVNDHPQWRVIKGGSARYVEKLTAGYRNRIRLNTRVQSVRRSPAGVFVQCRGALAERFDRVFLACHSDQALALLADASVQEREVLGAIPYQENEAVLHTDVRLLPRRRLAWAAWNYHVLREEQDRVAVTYNLNILQGLASREPFLVTLNNTKAIDPRKIIKHITYHHPVFTPEGVAAQGRQADINGVNRAYFCGAYWRYGFHEDGVASALSALEHFHAREALDNCGRQVLAMRDQS